MNRMMILCIGLFFAITSTMHAQTCNPGSALIAIQITPDNYPAESSWDVRNAATNQVIASGATNDTSFCYPDLSCLKFTMYDSYGDGICCSYGQGSYQISVNGQVIHTGGQFANAISHYINCPPGSSCELPFTAVEGLNTAPVAGRWYAFQPDTTGQYEISTCGNSCDTKIWIYDHCQNLVWDNTNIGTVFYNDNNLACGNQAVVDAVLDASQTYYIRIGDVNGACGNNAIPWSIQYQGPVQGCTDPNACNYNPLATISDTCIYPGSPLCPSGPDLIVMTNVLASSLQMDQVQSENCTVAEGCLNGYGTRDVLRFTTHIKNIGTQDYYIGSPQTAPSQFTFDNCHGHWHYSGYAEYILYDALGNALPIGFKNGFCVMDLECSGGGTAQYGCSNMGISNGCGDIYDAGLDCQWIDITDVDTGRYMLVVRVNWDQSPDALGRHEMNYTNNWGQVCIRITEDQQGNKGFLLENNCNQYVDCLGITYGNAVMDCNGQCNGGAVRGDLNSSDTLEMQDAYQYVSNLVTETTDTVSCNDMNADGRWTVFDAALITNCKLNGPSQVNDPCNFPTGILNALDTVSLMITGVNLSQQYIDVSIKNPHHKVTGYEFKVQGINILTTQNLINPVDFSAPVEFAVGGQHVASLSYQGQLIPRYQNYTPLCRIFYSSITDTAVCLDAIIDVVNENYEQTITRIDGNCWPLYYLNQQTFESPLVFEVFPNPTSADVTVQFAVETNDNVQFFVKDAVGKIVYTTQMQNVQSTSFTMPLANLAPGIYFVTCTTGSRTVVKKVIKS